MYLTMTHKECNIRSLLTYLVIDDGSTVNCLQFGRKTMTMIQPSWIHQEASNKHRSIFSIFNEKMSLCCN